jgi:broad specificity phosphatase PhoE
MPTFTLVRHGATVLNEQDRLRGWMDPALSRAGRDDAVKVRQTMLCAMGYVKKPVYTSDLWRARETAELIFGVAVECTKALRPWNVGTFAGQPGAIVHPLLEEYRQTDVRVPFGERFSDFTKRLQQFVHGIHGDAVLVTHYRVVKYLKFLETGRWDLELETGNVVSVSL